MSATSGVNAIAHAGKSSVPPKVPVLTR